MFDTIEIKYWGDKSDTLSVTIMTEFPISNYGTFALRCVPSN